MRQLKSAVIGLGKQKVVSAVVLDVLGNRCSVRLSENGRRLTGLVFYGAKPERNDQCYVDYSTGVPVVHTSGAGVNDVTQEAIDDAINENRYIFPTPASEADGGSGGGGAGSSGFHNDMLGLQGGDEGDEYNLVEMYHLSEDAYDALTGDENADDYHFHAGHLWIKTTDPTIDDDEDDAYFDYAVGDEWLNTTSLRKYVAQRVDSGDALWMELTNTQGGDGQNGFPDADDVELVWDDATRTLEVSPASSQFEYYLDGVKYTETGTLSEQVADTEGVWVFYISAEGVLSSTHSPSHSETEAVILGECIVAYVYWDATNNDGRLFYELHGSRMSPATHHYLHDNLGAIYSSGMALSDFEEEETGDADEHAQFAIGSGTFYDEDIGHSLAAIGAGGTIQIWYRSGSDWRWTTNAGFHVLTTGSGRLAWDNAGTLTEIGNNDFVLCHIFGTNVVDDDGTNPKYVAIVGQAEYLTRRAARTGAETEIANLSFGALPLPEMVRVATVIFQTSNGYTNSVQGRVRKTESGDTHVDWRTSNPLASGVSISDHGGMGGLDDDDHLHYHTDARGDLRYCRQFAGKTVAPTADDDTGDGYQVSDIWIDETADKAYIALDVTATAAVWTEVTGGGGGTPGGNDTELQFSDVGVFAGAAGLKWDKTNSNFVIGNTTAGVAGTNAIHHAVSGASPGIGLWAWDTYTGFLKGYKAGGSPGSESAVTDAMALLKLRGAGYYGAGWSASMAAIEFLVTENWTASAQGTQIVVKTTPKGTTAIQNSLIVDENGLEVPEKTAKPDENPAANAMKMFVANDKLYLMDDAGNIYEAPWTISDDFTFVIASFTDNEASPQLIGSGVWKAIGALSFDATYDNGPPTSSYIALTSDGGVSWAGNLNLSTPFLTVVSTEETDYPSTKDKYIRVTLNATEGADPDTDPVTVYFRNLIYWGIASKNSGFSEADVEALANSELSNDQTRSMSLNPGSGEYLVFAFPSTYTAIKHGDDYEDDGHTGFLFNSIACAFKAPEIVSITNAAGFTEDYDVYACEVANLGSATLITSTGNSTINPLYYGKTVKTDTFLEADVEGLANSEVTNDNTQTWDSVTTGSGEYMLFAFPKRLGTVSFWVGGFEGGFESPETVSVTNANGFTEDYYVWRSTNSNLGATVVETT